MSRDTIVDEVRKAREEYARKFNFDLHAICEDLRKQEQLTGGPVVSLPRRPPVSTPLGLSDAGTGSPAKR
jgi:hypothetical protein